MLTPRLGKHGAAADPEADAMACPRRGEGELVAGAGAGRRTWPGRGPRPFLGGRNGPAPRWIEVERFEGVLLAVLGDHYIDPSDLASRQVLGFSEAAEVR